MSSISPTLTEIEDNPAHQKFMQRCLDLASLGAGYTAPNPLVGAILVHEGRIIGEGYHRKYGESHAEVNCINSVGEADKSLITSSTLYVSLEPCCHYGKTPPCTDLILREKIPKVVIACRDPFPAVDGKGIEKLKAGGVTVIYPVLKEQAEEMNRRFFIFHNRKRPFVILKWAETVNHKIAGENGKRIQISNPLSNRLIHRWRGEEAGILVGSQTALMDDPALTARLWPGKNPVRIVLDRSLRLPDSLKLFDGTEFTIILNESTDLHAGKRLFKKIDVDRPVIASLLLSLYQTNILSILVEGGAKLLQFFLDEGIWDELRIITNQTLSVENGISAPEFGRAIWTRTETFENDTIRYFENPRIQGPG
jgi:diaminohydroxyphosphoribosylaminopyrimidine deaminase / 5-amino-6-(5-phosphoribosylamino)uracil reductase